MPASMKIALLALCCAALASIAAIAKADDADRLVDCGKFKAVIMTDTESKDGRYAVGWTITPTKKGLKPVNWLLWNPNDRNKLLDRYHILDVDAPGDYWSDYLVVDLQAKQALDLPAEFGTVRGDIDAVWSKPAHGVRHGLLNFEYHHGTGVFLVNIDEKGTMHLIDPGEVMDDAIDSACTRPKKEHGRGVWVPEYSVGAGSFHETYADVQFTAQLMNTDDDVPAVDGTVRLRLSDGKVMQVVADGETTILDGIPSPDYDETKAIRNNPELKKADDELNAVYRSLVGKLAPAARKALRQEQLSWIQSRDAAVENSINGSSSSDDLNEIRDKAQLEATRKRTAELKARLAAAH
jgi:uncharacterized protein YecT (DUF1311 family)